MRKLLLLTLAFVASLTAMAQTNLALNKAAIATSGNAGQAVDGDNGTRWESASSDPQTWQVDLGSAQTFNTISIRWEGAYGKTFTIEAGNSVDGDGYLTGGTEIVNINGQSLAGFPYVQNLTFASTTARYIKFNGIERGTGYGYSFWEFGVYNLAESLKLTSLTLSAPETQTTVGKTITLTASGKDQLEGNIATGTLTWESTNPTVGTVADGVFTALSAGETTITAKSGSVVSNAVTITVLAGSKIDLFTNWQYRIYTLGADTKAASRDGMVDDNDGSLWELHATTAADEASRTYETGFIADLGAIYDINTISIHFEGACSEAFTLSFAGNDGVFGSAVYTGGVAGINNHTETFSGESVTGARYVKFLSTKASSEWGVKIYDFSVVGSKTAEASFSTPSVTAATVGTTTDESITLNLTAANDGSAYVMYEVAANGVAARYFSAKAGEATAIVVDGLASGTTYNFAIYAINAVGTRSAIKEISGTTTGETFVLTAAPVPTKDAANVKSIYSNTYTPATAFDFGNWGQATQVSTETVDENEMLHLTNYNYLGFEYATDLDIADMDYIHIDVLPMQAMDLGITPIMRGGLTEKSTSVGTLNVKEWNSIDLPLADFGFDFDYKTFQLKIDRGTGSDVVYVDNIYFWKESTTPAEKTIYLEPNIWDASDATEAYAAYVWDGEGDKWIAMTPVEDTPYYTANIPANYTGLIFVRGEAGTEINWDNKWNQTVDIDFTAVANNTLFTITAWHESGDTGNSIYTTSTYVAPFTFTATFKNSIGWENVYAYTYGPETLGTWPGTKMTLTDGVYTISFKAVAVPANIIFNDGTLEGSVKGVNQTDDLDFVNGKEYDLSASITVPTEPTDDAENVLVVYSAKYGKEEITTSSPAWGGYQDATGNPLYTSFDYKELTAGEGTHKVVHVLGTGINSRTKDDTPAEGYTKLHAAIWPTTATSGIAFKDGGYADRVSFNGLTPGQWNYVELSVNFNNNYLTIALDGETEFYIDHVYYTKPGAGEVEVSVSGNKATVIGTVTAANVDDVTIDADKAAVIDLTNATIAEDVTITPTNINAVVVVRGTDRTPDENGAKVTTQNLVVFDGTYYLAADGHVITLVDDNESQPAYDFVINAQQDGFTYTRTVAAGKWVSFNSPAPVTIPAGVDVYKATAATASQLTFTKQTNQALGANDPVILYNAGGEVVITSEIMKGDLNLTANPAAVEIAGSGVEQHGTFRYVEATGDEFALQGGELKQFNAGAKIGAFRVYFTGLEAGATARFDDGQTTGIFKIENGQLNIEDGVYDLSGRRVEHPTKGIYIVNGRKVVIK